MIIWGAIWGAILSLFVSRSGDWIAILGALVGALAGWTLRKAVRSEVLRLTAEKQPIPLTQKAAASPVPASSAAVEQAQPVQAATEPPAADTDVTYAFAPLQPSTRGFHESHAALLSRTRPHAGRDCWPMESNSPAT